LEEVEFYRQQLESIVKGGFNFTRSDILELSRRLDQEILRQMKSKENCR